MKWVLHVYIIGMCKNCRQFFSFEKDLHASRNLLFSKVRIMPPFNSDLCKASQLVLCVGIMRVLGGLEIGDDVF